MKEQYDVTMSELNDYLKDTGASHDAHELLSFIKYYNETLEKEIEVLMSAVLFELKGLTDYENQPVNKVNFMQVIRKNLRNGDRDESEMRRMLLERY